MLDLCGKGRFTIFTGIGGEGWIEAAASVGKELGIDIATVKVGPGCDIEDQFGDWANLSEVRDSGLILVRPDQHVCWRSEVVTKDPASDLKKAMNTILARG